jgi:hypothetical protein
MSTEAPAKQERTPFGWDQFGKKTTPQQRLHGAVQLFREKYGTVPDYALMHPLDAEQVTDALGLEIETATVVARGEVRLA